MLSTKETITEDTLYVSVSREISVVLEGIGPIDTPRLLLKFSQQVLYEFQVLLVSVESGEYDDQLVRAILDQLLPTSGYILCPGLNSYSPGGQEIELYYLNIPIMTEEICVIGCY